MMKYLTASCPLLQDFRLITCHGFKRFCVYGHQNLENVWICCHTDTPVERIDIEAPNLSNLFVRDKNRRGAPLMNLASCTKLTVTYCGNLLPNSNGFTDFLSNFPFIETLLLKTSKRNNLKLSSHSLRKLLLRSDCDLENIELSTPNLVFLINTCKSLRIRHMVVDTHLPLLRASTHVKSCMQCYPYCGIEALWFRKLRQFLDNKSGFKVLNLYINAYNSEKFTELEKLKAIKLPPYELEHVELQLDTREETSAHVAFVDAVLWCCRPRSLTLRSSSPLTVFEEQCDVVKFTYEKLLQQEDQGHTIIQIVSSSSSEAQKQFMDMKSLSMSLPRERKRISFIKEEGMQRISRFSDVLN